MLPTLLFNIQTTMKKIVIAQPSQRVDISSKEIYTHTFTAHNLSQNKVGVTKKTASCGCTAVDIPDTIQPLEIFEIKVSVNKLGSSGIYSVHLTLEFENESHTLRLSGNILN